MHRRPMAHRLVLAAAAVTAAPLTSFAMAGASGSPPDTATTQPSPPTTLPSPPTTQPPPPATDDPGPDTTTAPPNTDPPATMPAESSVPQTSPLQTPPPPAVTTPATRPAPEPAPTPTEAEARRAPLRILLTNDDGWDAEGISAVRDALIAAGHDVVVVAPATNQSGVGGRVTFVGELTLTQHDDGVFSVDGSPADATELGLDIAFGGELPDLVISGSNAGQNIGAVAVHSGTLGAAVTALNEGVPAIAVSTETDLTTGEADFAGTAVFVAAAVEALAADAGDGPLLPAAIGLSINFPFVADGDPAGVAITTTDTGFVDLDYSEVVLPAVGEEAVISPGLTIVDPVDVDAVDAVDAVGDSTQLAADLVTITFITGNYDVAPAAAAESVDEIGSLLVDLGL